jgi:hypothetical protein
MTRLFGGVLELPGEVNIEKLVDEMDKPLAIKLLECALENCTDKFSLLENHIIYKSLLKLKQNENQNQGDHLHNDDSNGDIN